MSLIAFDESIKRQIQNVVDYAKENIYKLDDILDMMNAQMSTPGEKTEHLVLVPVGRWICYYMVDHPEKGLCHYFSFKPDASGELPDKSAMAYVLKEFGVESRLHDDHIFVDNKNMETQIILPIPS